jgi:hypothetical protein
VAVQPESAGPTNLRLYFVTCNSRQPVSEVR